MKKGALKIFLFFFYMAKTVIYTTCCSCLRKKTRWVFILFFSFTTVVFGLYRTKYADVPESNGFSSKSPSHVLGYFVITVNEKEDF